MATRRPNILFIMSDDHASHAISCYTGADASPPRPAINKTPNIDRIANEGMRFDNCFCTNSICTPSRAVILTGKHSHNPLNGVKTFLPMDNELPNVAKDLQAAGYQTAIFGKWHLGLGPRHCPKGFDEWKVLPGQGEYFDPEMHVNDPAVPGGRVVKAKGYTTDIITRDTLDFLARRDKARPFFVMCHHKAPHRPWLADEAHWNAFKDAVVPLPASFTDDYSSSKARANACMRIEKDFDCEDVDVLPPAGTGWKVRLAPPPRIEDYMLEPFDRFDEDAETEGVRFSSLEARKQWLYQRYMRKYLAVVASVDDSVGQLLAYLDKEGLAEDTIVMYTSDQGFFLGDHGWYDKRFMYEESLRMPFLLRYPRAVRPGTTSKALVLNLDFAPTWLDYAGVPIPKEMQGTTFREILESGGQAPPGWRTSMYYRYWMEADGAHNTTAHYGIRTVGPGRPAMKLIYYYADGMGIPDTNQFGKMVDVAERDKYKHVREWECFDLDKDPYEMRNIYKDPARAAEIKALKGELHRLQAECGDVPYPEEEP
ncbi:MAG: sulfatase [Candidatus Sigynarchaeum springense]